METILWLLRNVLIFYPHQIQQLTGQGKKITAPQKKYFIILSVNVFSANALIEDTSFMPPSGDRTDIVGIAIQATWKSSYL